LDDLRLLVNNIPYELKGYVESPQPDKLQITNFPVEEGKVTLAIRQGADTAASPNDVAVTKWARWHVLLVAIALTLVGVAIVYTLMSFQGSHIVKGREYKIRALFIEKQTNTYSLSILQFHLWTIAAGFGYIYCALSRLFVQWTGLPEVDGNVPGIIGIGIGTAVGSQVVSMVSPKGSGDETPSPSDYLTSGGSIAPDRVQMLVWTLIGVAGFVAGVVREAPATIQNLPGVPSTLLALMGLSSAGYLGAKFARKAGPNIAEISVMPSFAQASGAAPAGAASVDLTQPISVATQALEAVKKMAAGLAATSSSTAVKEATNAVTALEAGVAAASAIQKSGRGSDGLPKLAEVSASSHTAATNAAAEFDKASGTPGAETARLSASIAQSAAAAAEELASSSGQIVSVAETTASQKAQQTSSSFRRVIEIRGQNLSSEGVFRVTAGNTDYDLPYRMLEMRDKGRAPEVVVPEEGAPDMAKTLRLAIVPSQLDDMDRKTYDAIFAQSRDLTLTIFNPDGQKSVKTVNLPAA
jgi:hypothetical protein